MQKVHCLKRRRHYTICVAATSDGIYTLSSRCSLQIEPCFNHPSGDLVQERYGVYPCLWPFLKCGHNLFGIFFSSVAEMREIVFAATSITPLATFKSFINLSSP